jgi:hypothetical protein
MTLWYHGGHYYESVLVGKSGRVQQGSVELAAPWLAQARPPCRNTHSAEAFLKQLLRTIPYSSKVIRSVQDIPPPWHREPHSEESRKKRAEAWNKFRSGPGRTICPPTRVKKGDLIEYEIYTYERLGGCVRRYTICFKNGKFVSIKDQECARGAGNAWYIM